MKKRIAIIIPGQPRMIDFCAPKYFELFNQLGNVDYFIQSYNEVGIKSYNSVKTLDTEEIIEKYKHYLKPKSILVTDYRKILKVKKDIDSVIENILEDKEDRKYRAIGTETSDQFLCFMSQIHGAELANKLKIDYEEKHNFKYDVVIKIRSDLVLQASYQPEFFDYLKSIILNLPKKGGAINHLGVTHMMTKSGRLEMGDFIFWGSSYTFDVYLKNIISLYSKLAIENLYKYLTNSLTKQLCMSRIQDDAYPSPEAYWARLGLENGISFIPKGLGCAVARPGVKEEWSYNDILLYQNKYIENLSSLKTKKEVTEWLESNV